jgi:RIO kinase 1
VVFPSGEEDHVPLSFGLIFHVAVVVVQLGHHRGLAHVLIFGTADLRTFWMERDFYASDNVLREIRAHNDKFDTKRSKEKGKDSRATVEQVLDPRTLGFLKKLIAAGMVVEFNGCISTGKEANVYHAKGKVAQSSEIVDLAIKIYKTSILVFRDREKYIRGERRFQNFCSSNPRKMVKMWAEKEMRNLKRLTAAGIPAPEAHSLKSHVLVLGFIGTEGKAAPRLKDADLSIEQVQDCYRQVVENMWRMFHQCNLVHADLSEYNLLWKDGLIYVIDVSQSVENDHPEALEFLRMDVSNVTTFFKKRNCSVMSMSALFEFVLDKTHTAEHFLEDFEEAMDKA